MMLKHLKFLLKVVRSSNPTKNAQFLSKRYGIWESIYDLCWNIWESDIRTYNEVYNYLESHLKRYEETKDKEIELLIKLIDNLKKEK